MKRLIIIFMMLATIRMAEARTNCPDNLWKGLIGEAISEGYEGMYSVACVYRNRIRAGLPLGCVAIKRKDLDRFVRKEGHNAEIMAKDIIRKVFIENASDVTGGAIMYENIIDFGKPYWYNDYKITITIGKHTFFRK